MRKTFNFREVANKVIAVLKESPATRDDDRLLLIKVWQAESKATFISEFFYELSRGKISHFETIRRARQKLQEKYPSLRGEKWEKRQKMAGNFSEQLNFLETWLQ